MIGFIPDTYVKYLKPPGDFISPQSVNYICPMPGCGSMVTFALIWPTTNSLLMFTEAKCPNCGQNPVFIYTDITKINKGKKKGKLYINPAPRIRHTLKGIEEIDKFNKELFISYESAIKSHNAKIWDAAAVMCRNTLEGIVKTLIQTEKQKKLYQLLEDLPNHIKLEKPILDLANAIREGGNLGAHFDLQKRTNEKISNIMIDFLDYIIEYIYIIPNRVEGLIDEIKSLPENANSE